MSTAKYVYFYRRHPKCSPYSAEGMCHFMEPELVLTDVGEWWNGIRRERDESRVRSTIFSLGIVTDNIAEVGFFSFATVLESLEKAFEQEYKKHDNRNTKELIKTFGDIAEMYKLFAILLDKGLKCNIVVEEVQ